MPAHQHQQPVLATRALRVGINNSSPTCRALVQHTCHVLGIFLQLANSTGQPSGYCNQLKATDAWIVNCTAQLSLIATSQLRVLPATHLRLVCTYQCQLEPALPQIVRDVNSHSLLSTAFTVAAFQCAA